MVFEFIFIILLLVLLYQLYLIKNKPEHFTDATTTKAVTKEEEDKIERPYVKLFDNNGNMLNVVLFSKPFGGSDEELKKFEEYKKKYIIIGITSYLEFPNIPSNIHEDWNYDNYGKYKYKDSMRGWLYCFRNPDRYLPKNIPKALISESDFIDCTINKPDPNIKVEYDFIYICLKVKNDSKVCDDWATYNKNWSLAKKCLKVMCEDFKLKGLLVGRKDCELPAGCHTLMEGTDMLDYNKLISSYKQCKFIFIPNEADASPRVLTEALSTNLACLVNNKILGGWKYVNDKTGEFFNDEHDIGHSLNRLLYNIQNNRYTPRKYFIENYSVVNTGKRLKKFLYDNYGNEINIPEDKVEYVTPDFSKKDFKGCEI